MDCSRAALAGPRVKGVYIEIKQIKLCAYTCLISVHSAPRSPGHSDADFTVPLFDQFMIRVMPGDSWRQV